MDHHIPEQAAGNLDVGKGRRSGVAARNDHLLEAADLASIKSPLESGKTRIEAAIEADQHWNASTLYGRDTLIDPRQRKVDRFLAEDCFASLGRRDAQVGVCIRRRRDEDSADGRVAERCFCICGNSFVRTCELLCRSRIDIDDVAQLGIRVAGQVASMDGADAAGAEQGKS
jgi:hypothetical protein